MLSLLTYLIYLHDLKYIKKEDLAVPLEERLSMSIPLDIICLSTVFI